MDNKDDAQERAQLHEQLAVIERQLLEQWRAGISVGGGIAFDDQRWKLEKKALALKARLTELDD